jgi:hypothetical protein
MRNVSPKAENLVWALLLQRYQPADDRRAIWPAVNVITKKDKTPLTVPTPVIADILKTRERSVGAMNIAD